MRTVKAESDQGLPNTNTNTSCPLTELLDTTECMNGEQSPDDTLRMCRIILSLVSG